LPRRSQKMLPWLTSRHASPEVNHPTQYITKSTKSRRLAYSACHASGRVFEIIRMGPNERDFTSQSEIIQW
jgi:hypothetical protein